MLSPHFSAEELGVNGLEQRLLDNALFLCLNILEPIRAYFGPVRVHDGYRDLAHNLRVGGKPTSFHLFEGGKSACDFDNPDTPVRNTFDWIRLQSGIQFDKVILETSNGVPSIVHIQVDRLNPPRRQAYTGSTGAGTVYVQVEVK